MKRLAWLLLLWATWWASGTAIADLESETRMLRDPDPGIRKKAAQALARIGKEAVPALKVALKKERSKDALAAILVALATIGPVEDNKEVRSEALKLLYGNKDVRNEAAQVLGRLGKGSSEALKKALVNKEVEVRRSALVGLGYLGADAKEHVKTITFYLSVKHPQPIRLAAAEALARIGTPAVSAVPELSKSGKDKDLPLRTRTVAALAIIAPADPKTLANVTTFMTEEGLADSGVNEAAKLGGVALPMVMLALQNKDETARFRGLQILQKMNVNDFNSTVAEGVGPLLKDESIGIRKAAMNVLGKPGVNAAMVIPVVAEAMQDKDAEVRANATAILNRFGAQAKGAAPQIAAVLKSKDPEVRKVVIGILTRMKADAVKAAPTLLGLVSEDADLLPDVTKLLDSFGAGAIPAFSDALMKSDNPLVRRLAAAQIGKLGVGGREGLPALTAALRDKDREVRTAVAESLEKVGKGVVPALREMLKDPDPVQRAQAVETLGEIGDKAKVALPEILATLVDKEPTVRFKAVLALKKAGAAKTSVAEISKLLKDPELVVRKAAVMALEDIGTEGTSAVPALAALLKETDKDLRVQCLMTLKSVGAGAAPAVPEILKLFKEKELDPEIKVVAVQALGKMGAGARLAVLPLIELFKDMDENIRTQASTALGDIGPDAIPELSIALKDPSKEVRLNATIALVNMGPKARAAVAALRDALKDKEAEVRKNAILALKEVGSEAQVALKELTDALLTDPDADVRSQAVQVLIPMAAKERLARLAIAVALRDKEAGVRTVAIEALSKMQNIVPTLILALKDKNKFCRQSAAETLERIGPGAKAAVPALNNATKDKDDAVREAALKALTIIDK